MMKPICTFSVIPALPPILEPLRELAYNLSWSWHHATIELFRRLDSDLWETTGHNPLLMLGAVEQAKLDAAAKDEGFLSHLDGVYQYYKTYMAGASTWFRRTYGPAEKPLIAYFSAEFGITECLTIFSGGLGVLAGDHLKSASDLGLPLVGVGLLYQQGYFRQYLNEAGWQQEAYVDNDFHNLPLHLEHRAEGAPITISVAYPGRTVYAQVWRAQVGRVPLYLLDTNLPANGPEDRDITDQLYGGDLDMRIRQEILLGIGGYRALIALGIEPTVCHINEGHSAFLGLERIRRLMETQQLPFAEAREAASAGLVFTTHTPVPAGHDYFPPELMDRYSSEYRQQVGLSRYDLLALGRQDPNNENEPFCMTVLALKLSSYSNGVSKLHGQVSRQMWQRIWPGVPEDEIPIGHVTNGVHIRSWISLAMNQLFDRYLGPRWQDEPGDKTVWQRSGDIAAEELWRTHERRRERLTSYVRRRLRAQLAKRGAPKTEVEAADEVLDPEALTIGFGRRFATYKRATLLLRDPERLARLLNNPRCPVQVIFAGKAHPRDEPGKALIQQIVAQARKPEFRRRLVFLEDYDVSMARYLVQGVDVWLNNPLRPREASGTSGMKAAANGALNLSTLDGWWDEAYRPELGWAIGRGETYQDADYQDQVEAEALYELLERDVVPAFYERSADGLPRRWIGMMKASIGNLSHFFNTHRMVQEYTDRFYMRAVKRYQQLTATQSAGARALAAWKRRVQLGWPQVRIETSGCTPIPDLLLGGTLQIRAQVQLGSLTPGDVCVEVYLGRVNADGDIVEAQAVPMVANLDESRAGNYVFQANIKPSGQSGRHGYTVRVIPFHPDLPSSFLPGMIVWA
jgi:glycogen phosphorylase